MDRSAWGFDIVSSFSPERLGSLRGREVVARQSQLSMPCVLAGDPQDLDTIVTEGRADFREATIVRSVDTGHFASSQEVLTLRFLCRAYSVGLSHRPRHRERSRMRVLDVLHGER